MPRTTPVLLSSLLLLLGLPAQAAAPLCDASTLAPAPGRIEISEFAGGLENPWAMVFLPDGRLLVSERPGRLRLIDA